MFRRVFPQLFNLNALSTHVQGTTSSLAAPVTSAVQLQLQQFRHGHKYVVRDGSIKWLRRRGKTLEQRLKVMVPSSPVIDSRTSLPPNNEGKYPGDLFSPSQGLFKGEDVEKEGAKVKGIIAEINRQPSSERLFAVISLKGKQFKVTTEDIVILQGHWAPNIGERIRLHKVLLLGSASFTLLGRPLLNPELVRVEGTVVEKTLSYTKLHFKLKKRKNFRRLKFHKEPYTMLRINLIELLEGIEEIEEAPQNFSPTVEGCFQPTAALL